MKRPLTERAARRELAAPLLAAEPEDVVKAIAFGLRFEGGRRVWQADEYMAVITAKRLIEHLTLSTASLSSNSRRWAAILRSGVYSKASDPNLTLGVPRHVQPVRPESTLCCPSRSARWTAGKREKAVFGGGGLSTSPSPPRQIISAPRRQKYPLILGQTQSRLVNVVLLEFGEFQ